MGGPEVETRYPEPVSYGIRRCELDHYLLQRSKARVKVGALRDLQRDRLGWVVNGEIRTPIVVGAGGHFCPVARRLGARTSGDGVVAAQEIEFLMDSRQERDCRVDPEVPELYFCPDLKGYGWCFRKQDCLNVGFGRLDDRRFSTHVRGFLAFLHDRRRIPPDTATRWKGHAYSIYPATARPLLDDGVVLVGDAAGLAYAESGEGIRPAVESGLMAARTVLLAEGSYTRESLASYQRAIEGRFGTRGKGGAPRVPAWITALAGAAVLRTPWLTRRLVVERWFLHRHESALTWDTPAPLASTEARRTAAAH